MRNACRRLRSSVIRGVGPTADQLHLVECIAQAETFPLWYVFADTSGPADITVRRFTRYSPDAAINGYWRFAREEVDRALKTYRVSVDRHGFDRPWFSDVPFKAFDDMDFQSTRWIIAEA